MTATETIKAARAWIEQHGWKQGSHYVPGGPGCLSVAFAQCGATIREQCEAWTLLRQKIDADMISWNDTPGRTVEDIYGLLDAVAGELR